MTTIPEQYSAALKAQIEAQISSFNALTSKALESVEKVIELNTTAAKASLAESVSVAQQLIYAKGPQEFFSLVFGQAQPSGEKAFAYSRHLATIASTGQAEISRVAQEEMAESSRKLTALLEEVAKAAPAGMEGVSNMVNSAVGNATAAYGKFSNAAKQATEVAAGQMEAAGSHAAFEQEKAPPKGARH